MAAFARIRGAKWLAGIVKGHLETEFVTHADGKTAWEAHAKAHDEENQRHRDCHDLITREFRAYENDHKVAHAEEKTESSETLTRKFQFLNSQLTSLAEHKAKTAVALAIGPIQQNIIDINRRLDEFHNQIETSRKENREDFQTIIKLLKQEE